MMQVPLTMRKVLEEDEAHTQAQTAAFQWLSAWPVRSPMCQRRLWHIDRVLRRRLSLAKFLMYTMVEADGAYTPRWTATYLWQLV